MQRINRLLSGPPSRARWSAIAILGALVVVIPLPPVPARRGARGPEVGPTVERGANRGLKLGSTTVGGASWFRSECWAR